MRDAFVQVEMSGRIQHCNDLYCQLVGYARDELATKTYVDLTPAHWHAMEAAIVQAQVLPRGFSDVYEKEYRRKDGTIVPIELRTILVADANGRPESMWAIVRDIGARKAAEAPLAASEARFRTIADRLPLIVWLHDREGRQEFVNQTFCDFFGVTREAMRDGRWRLPIDPESGAAYAAAFAASVRERRPFHAEVRVRRADGEWRWMDSWANPHFGDDGEFLGHIGTSADITERHRQEERLTLLMRELNHRCKNILALVLSVARVTAARTPETFLPNFEERLRAIAAAHDLLVGRNWRDVLLADLARSQVAHLAELADGRITIAGPDVSLAAQAAQILGMALHELATNAVKHGALSQPSGRVTVAWELVQAPGSKDRCLQLSWVETGGPRVAPPSRRGFGTTVVETMIRSALGCAVAYRFEPEGVVWRIDCSAAKLSSAPGRHADPTAAAIPHGDGGRPRILIVEDEVVVALELAEALRANGFEVLGPAGSVGEAIALLEGARCDAGILDVNLGAETSEPVAATLTEAGVPFVVVTGYAASQLPAIFREAPLLPKPLVVSALVARLRACLARRLER
jgi:PAS domain S-box-containing protein